MQKLLLALAAVALLGSVIYLQNRETIQDDEVPSDIQQQFVQFKKTYNKKYGSSEDQYRLQVFYDNVKFVQNYNAEKGTATFGQTMFFDLTDEEFAETYLTELVPESTVRQMIFSNTMVADSIDWRTKGAVTPVKNQGQCGSCWAFSTTGALEGYFFVKTGQLLDLSEQQLVDCAGITYGNMGCNGGMPGRAMNFVQKNGLTTQDKYPYKAVKGSCSLSSGEYKNKDHKALTESEDDFLNGLAIQPISIAVDATNWKYYDPKTKEIFEDCDTKINHGVLAIGYTADYYIVKNSWSTQWGIDGYIHLKRGNTCAIWSHMTLPL